MLCPDNKLQARALRSRVVSPFAGKDGRCSSEFSETAHGFRVSTDFRSRWNFGERDVRAPGWIRPGWRHQRAKASPRRTQIYAPTIRSSPSAAAFSPVEPGCYDFRGRSCGTDAACFDESFERFQRAVWQRRLLEDRLHGVWVEQYLSSG